MITVIGSMKEEIENGNEELWSGNWHQWSGKSVFSWYFVDYYSDCILLLKKKLVILVHESEFFLKSPMN